MGVTVATVRRLALALPDVVELPHHEMTSFRVAGKIFVTVPPSGDRAHAFVDASDVASYCAEFSGAVEELYWGKKLRGCRVLLRQATQPMLSEVLTAGWCAKAPKKLLAEFEAARA
jgi:hypothetical protein